MVKYKMSKELVVVTLSVENAEPIELVSLHMHAHVIRESNGMIIGHMKPVMFSKHLARMRYLRYLDETESQTTVVERMRLKAA